MKIWLLFCLLSVAVADSYKDESNDANDLNIGELNDFGNRAIYPFDAFNLGYDKFFSRIHPPLIAAMNRFVPTPESSKSDVERSREISKEQSVSSKNEKVSFESSSHTIASIPTSETKQSNFDSKDTSKSSEKSESDKKQSNFESKDASKSSEKSESIEEHKNFHSDLSISNISGEKEQSASSKSKKVSVEISSSNSESSSKTVHSKYEQEIASVSGEKSESSLNAASRVSSDAVEKHSEIEHLHISEEKTETHDVSSSNSKRDKTSETSQLLSGENQSKSESKFASSSSETDIGKSASESSDIGSDATIFVSKSVEKSESEVVRVSMSNEEAENVKSSSVSSDDVEVNSAQEDNKKESDSESDARSVSGNVSSSSEKIGSFSAGKSMSSEMGSRKSLSSEADLTFDPAYVNDEMACDAEASAPESWIASEIQHPYGNKDLAHKLSMQDIRKTLEDGYKNLAQIKKRLFKKEIAVDDLNQVIGDLQVLCEKICQEVPVKYLVP